MKKKNKRNAINLDIFRENALSVFFIIKSNTSTKNLPHQGSVTNATKPPAIYSGFSNARMTKNSTAGIESAASNH